MVVITMSSPLISFLLPANPPSVLYTTFLNDSFFPDFLKLKLKNINISQSSWVNLPELGGEQNFLDHDDKSIVPGSLSWLVSDQRGISRSTRCVSSYHPISSSQSYLKLLMGFLPSYSEV